MRDSLARKIEDLSEDLMASQRHVSSLEHSLEAAKESKSLGGSTDVEELSRLNEELRVLRETDELLASTLSQAQQERDSALSKLVEAEERLRFASALPPSSDAEASEAAQALTETLQKENVALSTRVDSLEAAVRDYEGKLSALESQTAVSDSQRRAAAQSAEKLKEATEKLSAAEAKLAQSEKEIQGQKKRGDEMKAAMDKISAKNTSLASELALASQVSEKLKSEAVIRMEEIQKIARNLEEERDTSEKLRSRMGELMEELQHDRDRSSRQKLATDSAKEDEAKAMAAKLKRLEEEVSSLRSSVAAAQAGEQRALSSSESVRKAAEDLTNALDAEKAAGNSLKKQVEKLSAEYAAALSKGQSLQIELDSALQRNRSIDAERLHYKSLHDNLQLERDTLSSQLSSSSLRETSVSHAMAAAQSELHSAQQKLDDLRKAREDIAGLREDLARRDVRIADLNSQLQGREKDQAQIVMLRERADSAEKAERRFMEALSETARKNEMLMRRVSELEDEAKHKCKECLKMSPLLTQLGAMVDDVEKRVSEMSDSTKDTLRSTKEKLEVERQRREVAEEGLKRAEDALRRVRVNETIVQELEKERSTLMDRYF